MKIINHMFKTAAGVMALLAVTGSWSATSTSAGELQAGDTVAICGDSITEQKQYSVFIEDYLLMCQPAPDLQAHQFGWSGEKADGFLNRMQGEVWPFAPTVVTTCYGMNDGGYAPIDAGREDAYRKNTEAIIKNFKNDGVRFIVIGSPGRVDTYTFNHTFFPRSITASNYNETLGDLARIAREVATEQNVTFADVFTPMTTVMDAAKAKYGEKYAVAGGDGIHPNANGHLVMAYAFLKALGCSGDIGTITWDAKSGAATATDGHKVLSAGADGIQLESTRYPFCFFGDPASPDSTRGVLEFLPFNHDLNRFLLVVTHGSAAHYKVTWGSASKTFSAEQLAQGVNLAAEFLDNPFADAFTSVDKAVHDQQNFETPAIKSVMHSLADGYQLLPDAKASLDDIRTNVVRKATALSAASRVAVVPVKHTIKIEPAD